MGRTLPTINDQLRIEEERWKPFRRTLRIEDQKAFDELWSAARQQAAAASMAGRAIPLEAFMMAMLVSLRLEVVKLIIENRRLQQQAKPNAPGPDSGLAV